MPIELKGQNYYSKVFKRINYRLSNNTFWAVISHLLWNWSHSYILWEVKHEPASSSIYFNAQACFWFFFFHNFSFDLFCRIQPLFLSNAMVTVKNLLNSVWPLITGSWLAWNRVFSVDYLWGQFHSSINLNGQLKLLCSLIS